MKHFRFYFRFFSKMRVVAAAAGQFFIFFCCFLGQRGDPSGQGGFSRSRSIRTSPNAEKVQNAMAITRFLANLFRGRQRPLWGQGFSHSSHVLNASRY